MYTLFRIDDHDLYVRVFPVLNNYYIHVCSIDGFGSCECDREKVSVAVLIYHRSYRAPDFTYILYVGTFFAISPPILDHWLTPLCCSIGSRGYFFFLLFQCFIVTAVDGVDPKPHVHTFQSTIIGGEGAYIHFPSHSILTYMGPNVWMLMLDCRCACCRV